MKKQIFGSKERAQKKKKREEQTKAKIRKKVDILIQDNMPSLFEEKPDISAYNRELENILLIFEGLYSEIKNLRYAHQYLESNISNKNKKLKLSLALPPQIMKVKRVKPARNSETFKGEKWAAELYRYWNLHLEVNNREAIREDMAIADAAISAVFNGGLCHAYALYAFINKIRCVDTPIYKSGEYCWMDLCWQNDKDPQNATLEKVLGLDVARTGDEESDALTLRRFYLDPITLGFCHVYLKERKDTHKNRLSPSSCGGLVTRRLRDVSKGDCQNLLKNLPSICKVAPAVTEMQPEVELPQLLFSYAKNEVKSASLLPETHARLFAKDFLYPGIIKAHVADGISTDSTKSRSLKPEYRVYDADAFIKNIRGALSLKTKGKKNNNKDAVQRLEAMAGEDLPLHAQILLSWLIYVLDRVKLVSVNRYFSALHRYWLTEADGQDLEGFDAVDFEQLYQGIVNQVSDQKKRAFLAGRLADIHSFCVEKYGFPNMPNFFAQYKAAQFIRVGYVNVHEFNCLRASVRIIKGFSERQRRALEVMLILAYRLGLRRGELVKIKVSDIENSDQNWVFIRNNQYGDNKSGSALRKLPIRLLLTDDEHAVFKDYFRSRLPHMESKPNALFFSDGIDVTDPWDPDLLTRVFGNLLAQLEIENPVFHTLRHSAISNMAVILNGNENLVEQLGIYDQEQAKRITKFLYSENPEANRDRYWVLAGFAGHSTPETTFNTYVHFTDLLLASRLRRSPLIMSRDHGVRLTGLSPAMITRISSQESGKDYIPTSDLHRKLILKMAPWIEEIRPKPIEIKSAQRAAKGIDYTFIEIATCYIVLERFQDGESVQELTARFLVDQETIEEWINNAEAIRSLRTQRGRYRHFSPERKGNPVIGVLIPPPIRDDRVKKQVNDVVDMISKDYAHRKADIHWAIAYYLNHAIATHTGLKFTSVVELERFTNAFKPLIKKRSWFLELRIPKSFDSRGELSQWKPLVGAVSYGKAGNKGKVTGFLYLRHLGREANMPKKWSKFSSYGLRYICHMLAILIGGDILIPNSLAVEAK